MLLNVSMTNFLSFKDKTEIVFTPTKYSILSNTNVSSNNVLKGALVIGPNASGKTNVLKAIGFLINLIKGTGTIVENYRCFFSANHLTNISYEFLFDDKKVTYEIGYDVTTKELSENLYIDQDTVLFRKGGLGELTIGSQTAKESKLENDTLFLRTASFNTGRFPNEPTLRKLMEFLNNSFYIDGYNQSAHFGRTVTKYAEEYGVEKLNKYLENFNYDFFVEYGTESNGEGLQIRVGSGQKSIFFKRKDFPIPTTFFTESQGNQVFADMLPPLINVIENPGMIVIDEFGNSLHNNLAEKIVNFFMRNSDCSQLFITSHDTNLISNSVFRPDQIYLVDFKKSQGSKIERLSKYKPREAQNMEKMYLSGMFEGLPLYDEKI